jgi:transcriptional regulator with XRE-family HTH domain
MTLGQRIRKILHDKELSQAGFTKISGVTTTSLSNYINDKNDPGLEFFISILNALPNLNARWLICEDGDPWLADEQVNEGIIAYNRSGPTQLREENRMLREQIDDKKKIIEMLEARVSELEGKKESRG